MLPASALTLEQAWIVDEACDEFEAGWKTGIPPDFQDFVESRPAFLQKALLDELYQIELQYREDADSTALNDLYRRHFPNWISSLVHN